jgi:hypothetical protein
MRGAGQQMQQYTQHGMWMALVALLAAGAAIGADAEAPQSEATVYYSKGDPRWPDAEKAVDAVAKEYAPFKVIKVCIDDDAGYRKLAEAEARLHIAPTGDLTAVIRVVQLPPEEPQVRERTQTQPKAAPKPSVEEIWLTSRNDRRDVEKCFAGIVKRLSDPKDGKGRLNPDVAPFAREVFGKDAVLEPSPDDKAEHNRYYPVAIDGKRVGWVVDAFRHIGCPTCNDMQFLMAVGLPEVKVLQIRPERDLERYATKVDEPQSGAFLNQLKGRTPASAQVRADAITGVTKTCHLYESTVRDALAEIQRREKP